LKESNKFMSRLGCREKILTVLNQAGIPGGIRPGDLVDNEKLNIGVGAVLPYSTALAEANNRRELVSVSRCRDDFSQALHRLADRL
jgi:hypothetical protein